MERREFIKTALLGAAVLSSGTALAYDGSDKDGGTGLQELKDKANPTPLEMGHVPAITAPDKVNKGEWFDVKVKVGFMKDHPSTPEHWITFVKLMVNGDYVAKTEYEVGGVSSSSALFRIRINEPALIYAVENCNLHGTWISEPHNVAV